MADVDHPNGNADKRNGLHSKGKGVENCNTKILKPRIMHFFPSFVGFSNEEFLAAYQHLKDTMSHHIRCPFSSQANTSKNTTSNKAHTHRQVK